MKRKLLNLVVAFCLIIVSAFFMTACDISSLDENADSENGAQTEQTKPMTKDELATTFKTVAKKAWKALGAGDPTEEQTTEESTQQTVTRSSEQVSSIRFAGAEIPNEMKEATGDKETQTLMWAASVIGTVYWVGNLYENENFEVSDKVVSFNVNMSDPFAKDPDNAEQYVLDIGFLSNVDKENGKIVIESSVGFDNVPLVKFPMPYNRNYAIIEIGYDFGASEFKYIHGLTVGGLITEEVSESFTIKEFSITEEGKCFYLEAKDDNGTINGCTDEYRTVALSEFDDYYKRKSNGLTLLGNFDKEFNDCNEISEKAGNAVYENIKTGKAKLAEIYKTIAKKTWEALGVGDPSVEKSATQTASVRLTSAELPNEMKEIENQDKWVKWQCFSTSIFSYLVGDYYEKEKIFVSDKVLSFNVTMLNPDPGVLNTPKQYSLNIGLLSALDKKNNRIIIEMSIECDNRDVSSIGNKCYFYIEIGFDFETSEFKYIYNLSVGRWSSDGEDESFNASEVKYVADGEKYFALGACIDNDGKLVGCSEDYKTVALSKFDDYFERKSDGIKLTGNFDKEYNNCNKIARRVTIL